MGELVIRAEGVGKRYQLGAPRSSLKEMLTRAVATPLRLLRQRQAVESNSTALWALRDLSFEIKQGEVVGVIGRNGAGKSTLLKILSRITLPTEGRVEMFGQVGALLEVGTGFHPELSGRENVYLNGAVLGMSRHEVRRKFEAIVGFAEVEGFIDTPVKHYSSGMYMRLAFAVAAHLEPEILIVDEVLAVGDAGFQRKCLGKMEEVGKQGRAVVFVSHDMAAVARLCPRALLLDHGRAVAAGPTLEVIHTYLSSGLVHRASREWTGPSETCPGDEWVRLRAVRVRTQGGDLVEAADIRDPIGVEIEFEVLREGRLLVPNLHLFSERGEHVFFALDTDPEWRGRPKRIGTFVSTGWIPGNLLAEGTFVVGVAVTTYVPVLTIHVHERDVVSFRVVDSMEGNSARGDYAGPVPGIVRPILRWTTRAVDALPHNPLCTKPSDG